MPCCHARRIPKQAQNIFELFNIPEDYAEPGSLPPKIAVVEKPGTALAFEPACLSLTSGTYDARG